MLLLRVVLWRVLCVIFDCFILFLFAIAIAYIKLITIFVTD